jgi:hypothetical protein
MKTTQINKVSTNIQTGEYSSIEELVQSKLKRASETLKNVSLNKVKTFTKI